MGNMSYQIDEIISCYAVDKNGTRTPIEFGKISNIDAECSLDGSKQVSITISPNEKGELFKITIPEKGDKELKWNTKTNAEILFFIFIFVFMNLIF